jgi:hypothetical protein
MGGSFSKDDSEWSDQDIDDKPKKKKKINLDDLEDYDLTFEENEILDDRKKKKKSLKRFKKNKSKSCKNKISE